jgi:gliding motility-associated-like protein
MRLLLAILLTMGALPAFATTFTVTTNADSGPGSLRDALQQAAANGSPDIIAFAIADQTQTGRTIVLATPLPPLTSNLTIDGTTQPGIPFGISNARVVITSAVPFINTDFFILTNVNNIQIYGLWLQSIGSSNCFHFTQANNLRFGASGKGNLIQGFAQVFLCDYTTNQAIGSTGITVQGNIMGTDPTGATAGATTFNGVDFYLRNVGNVQIGGLNPGEGNLMVEQDLPMDYSSSYNNNFGFINIEGNTQGTDITGLIRLSPSHFNFSIDAWNGGTQEPVGTAPVQINILNNVSVGGFSFFEVGGPIVVQGNHLGVGADNSTNIISGAPAGSASLLSFTSCAQALVGGSDPADKNYIAYDGYGVIEYYSENITISRNSFFCNTTGIQLNWTLSRSMPVVNITTLTAGAIGGTALPNSTIELFYDDECPGCEGKTYIGTTTADNSGNWTYPLTATGAVIATATDTYGATSAFSTASIDTKGLAVTNATCGHNNGSIKNLQVTSGTEWYWEDALGNIVANSTDLTNVGPGTYTFVASIGGASCKATSTPYTITNVILPVFDPSAIEVTQTGCGLANGSFQYSGSFDPSTTYSWLSAGAVVCPDFSAANPLGSLTPGTYTLQLTLKQDPTCIAQYGPYTLVNQNGPTVNRVNVQVIPASCGKTDGSITGMSYQNAIPPIYFAWEGGSTNDNLQVVARTLDLVGVNPGSYRFVFKDGSSCDTIFTNLYIIPDNGAITYDTSAMVVTPASCEQSNGSIIGIMSTNAATYAWVDVTSGSAVGDLEDLMGIGGGVYQLSMSNAYGCQAQTPAIAIPQLGYPSAPQAADQYIPRNTPATIAIADPRQGLYELFNGPSPASTILDTSSIGVLHTPDVPQNETVYVALSYGDCLSPLTPVNIKVFDSVRIFVPNAFTPNGDGANDRWHIIIQGLTKQLQVSVYDRWGAMVFRSNDPNLAWDGTAGGHALSGAFVYVVAGVDYFNKAFVYKGTLMILR